MGEGVDVAVGTATGVGGRAAALLRAVRRRDAGLAALRRACRAAIVAPGLFALSFEVIGNAETALFASFGSISLLLFVDFGGRIRDRLAAQCSLALAGAVLVTLGTLASRTTWTAAIATAVVAFGVLFTGVVSSVLAGASTALLAGFVLSVSVPGPMGEIPDRLAGYGMAGAASVIAVGLLWPAPTRDPLRAATARSCALLARRLRAEVECVESGHAPGAHTALDDTAEQAAEATAALRRSFYATPYRPTGLSTEARALVRLVDDVVWLETILDRTPVRGPQRPSDPAVSEVKRAAAEMLQAAAGRLEAAVPDPAGFQRDLARLRTARKALESAVVATPAPGVAAGSTEGGGTEPLLAPAGIDAVSSLEPGFRAQETAAAVAVIAANAEIAAAAGGRPWWQRVLGRGSGTDAAGTDVPVTDVPSSLVAAQERAGAHVEPHSVWLHNSLRGATALGLAVLVAELTGLQHSFWVALGALAVLRSSALLTGQNALRALLGTVVGTVLGGVLIYALGSDTTALWVLLPAAVLFAGLAPAAISFAAGQAGFTALLLIMFNIIAPAGWAIGLVRFEDVAIGCAVSVGVGALFWPHGAGAALGRAASEAIDESARYLRRSIEFGVSRCDALAPDAAAPDDERRAAAAAARRLDDAFRGFLAERGTKHLPLADVTVLLSIVAVLRLSADAVHALWQRDDGEPSGDRTAARLELLRAGTQVTGWYQQVARALAGDGPMPAGSALPAGSAASGEPDDSGLVAAVRRDLAGEQGRVSATAIRMIWTADHIDVARRLQAALLPPARAAAALQQRPGPRDAMATRPPEPAKTV
ncbi:Fusaric acid resistance protein-like [Actinacidiphila yanglinensis]|uniref:Fusaric acid resistance protein-like n=1 Tax=Actinacidiphila yanglinensis TaxID=310779 RepID=A0A1H6E4H6_9ACTN|nr:FUSC family protein [Actinacidiphila yanglinensis]SEG91795.1 Fusaric acid resistance protein-like [Actinacidiphila yanglinensis]